MARLENGEHPSDLQHGLAVPIVLMADPVDLGQQLLGLSF
jgi:hypothetical protein